LGEKPCGTESDRLEFSFSPGVQSGEQRVCTWVLHEEGHSGLI